MAYQQGPPGQPPSYGPPGYGPPPGYGWPPPVPPSSGYATASLVFGILGIVGGWCMFGLPCIVAIVAGHFGLAETKHGQKTGHGNAIAGLILGYIGVIPMAFFTFFLLVGWLGSGTSSAVPAPDRTRLTVTQPAADHTVTFEAEGKDGAKLARSVTYNVGTSIGQGSGIPLPYSKTVQASEDATVSLWVQNADTDGSVACRIKVDGKVFREDTGEGPYGVCTIRADSLSQ